MIVFFSVYFNWKFQFAATENRSAGANMASRLHMGGRRGNDIHTHTYTRFEVETQPKNTTWLLTTHKHLPSEFICIFRALFFDIYFVPMFVLNFFLKLFTPFFLLLFCWKCLFVSGGWVINKYLHYIRTQMEFIGNQSARNDWGRRCALCKLHRHSTNEWMNYICSIALIGTIC